MSDDHLEDRPASEETALINLPPQGTSLSVLPLFLLDDEDRRRKQGLSYETTMTVDDREGTFQWQVTADLTFGFPDAFDRKVFKIIEYMALQKGLPVNNPVHFSLYQVLQLLGLPPFGVHFARVRSSLQRIAALKIHAHLILPGAHETGHQAQTFHLYDDLIFQEESFGHEIGAGNHQVVFGDWYLAHLNHRRVRPVDVPYFQRLQNPIASRLYELLSLKFERVFAQNEKGWSVSYAHLCALLPLKQAGWMSSPQRQLEAAHDELVANDFIDRVEWSKADREWSILYIPGHEARAAYEAMQASEKQPEPVSETLTARTEAPVAPEEDTPGIEEAVIPEGNVETDTPEETAEVVADEETPVSQDTSDAPEDVTDQRHDQPPESEPVMAEHTPEEEPAMNRSHEQEEPEATVDEETMPVPDTPDEETVKPETPVEEKPPASASVFDKADEESGETPQETEYDGQEPEFTDTCADETDADLALTRSASRSKAAFTSRGVAMFDDLNGQHAVCNIQYHIAWMTKSRDRILNDGVAIRTRDMLRDFCAVREVKILRGTIAPDHVHLAVSCPPTISPADLINDLKDRASKKLQEEFPALQQRYWGHSVWAGSYLCMTVGDMSDDDLDRYLESQKPEEAGDESFQVVSSS